MSRLIRRVFWLTVLLVVIGGAGLGYYAFSKLPVDNTLQFTVRQGSLRSAARQMESAGLLVEPWRFEALARVLGMASRIKAGNYEVFPGITALELLRKVTSSDFTQDQIVFVEGWTLTHMRAMLDASPALKHDTQSLNEADIAAQLGTSGSSLEGLLFPDTYYFANGSSDIDVLTRAYRAMQNQLTALWATRAPGLPLENSYQALILASIVEKETGRPEDRPLIAAVFINRLKIGMRLQTDPSVIYGMGPRFDGNLRKADLLSDGPYNTYTRAGLPPTPIASPGLAAIAAVLHPAASKALYFVSRNDGSSYFSETLAEHERAVTKYQRHLIH